MGIFTRDGTLKAFLSEFRQNFHTAHAVLAMVSQCDGG